MENSTRFAKVVPIGVGEIEALHYLQTQLPPWSPLGFRGATPGVDQLGAKLAESGASGWLVVNNFDELLGAAILSEIDLTSGVGWFSILKDPGRTGAGASVAFLDGVGLILDLIFRSWPLRIVSMEASQSTLAQFASGHGRYFVVEATLANRVFFDGFYEDLHILSLSREMWMTTGRPRWQRLEPNESVSKPSF